MGLTIVFLNNDQKEQKMGRGPGASMLFSWRDMIMTLISRTF